MLWGGGVVLEREGGNRKNRKEIFEMDIRSGQRDTRLYGKRRITKREVKRKGWKKGLGFYEKRLEEERGSEAASVCWEELKEESRKRKVTSNWKKERNWLFRNKGVKLEEVERRRIKKGEWFKKLDMNKGEQEEKGGKELLAWIINGIRG